MGDRPIAFQYKTYNVDGPADAAARLSGAEFLTVAAGKVTGIDDYYKYPADTRPRELSAAGEPDEVERSLRNLDRHWYRVDRADRDRVRP